MIVVDASAAVALLTDGGPVGQFVASTINANELAYPSLLPYEVASALRRMSRIGAVSVPVAQAALRDATALGGEVFEFDELADRAWQLRDNLTVYDAAYVALAEAVDAPLLTLDTRIAAAPGVRCRFLQPPKVV